MTFFDRRVTCHLMIQPRIAEQFLADPDLRDQGLLSRTLIAWPASRIGLRLIPPGQRPDRSRETERLDAFHRRIIALLELGLPEGPPRPLALKTLSLSDITLSLLQDFHNHVEAMQADGGPLKEIRGFASKAVEQAARTAGVLQIFEDETADHLSEANIVRAIEIMDWYLGEVKRLLEGTAIPAPIQQAEKLRTWLTNDWKGPHISLRAIVNSGPGALRTSLLAQEAVQLLEQHGWVVSNAEPRLINGVRSKKTWRIIRG